MHTYAYSIHGLAGSAMVCYSMRLHELVGLAIGSSRQARSGFFSQPNPPRGLCAQGCASSRGAGRVMAIRK